MWMLVSSVSSAFLRAPCWILSRGLSRVIHLGKSKFGRITWTKPALPAEGDLAKLLCSSRDFRGQSDGQMGRCNTSPVICASSRLNSKGQAFAPPCRWYSRVDKRTFSPGRTASSACLFHLRRIRGRRRRVHEYCTPAVCIQAVHTRLFFHSFTLAFLPFLFSLAHSWAPSPSPSLHIWPSDGHPNWESWQCCIYPFRPWWRCRLLYWHLSMLIRSERTRQRFHTVLKSN